jgi:hypothetical protein
VASEETLSPSHRLWIGAFTVLMAAIGFVAGRGFLRPTENVLQPIAFNHLWHTQDLQLTCDFCHEYVRQGAHSGLPSEETCAMCHSTPQGDSEEAARVTELLEAGEPLVFKKLFGLPDHVFYTHRRHVVIGEVECAQCHGDIANTESPPERPLVTVDMAFCMDCHTERDVTNDCTACHR